MPTYEYKCDACGHEFEKFQSMTAAPVKVCPECSKRKVRKLISTGAGLIFKGSGFYITDYRDQGYKDKAKSESGESKTESKPAETKSAETKTETPKAETPKKESPKPEAKPKRKKE